MNTSMYYTPKLAVPGSLYGDAAQILNVMTYLDSAQLVDNHTRSYHLIHQSFC